MFPVSNLPAASALDFPFQSESAAPARSRSLRIERRPPARRRVGRDRRNDAPCYAAPAVSQPFKRALGPFDATMIVIGGIIGSGIFINPHIVARTSQFVGAGDRRVDRRSGDRAHRRALVRRARRDVPGGRRSVRLSARCVSPADRLSVRVGAALHDRERRHGGGRHDVRGIRSAPGVRSTAGIGADWDERRASRRDRRDRVPLDHQLPRRDTRQPAAERIRRPEGGGTRRPDRRRAVLSAARSVPRSMRRRPDRRDRSRHSAPR